MPSCLFTNWQNVLCSRINCSKCSSENLMRQFCVSYDSVQGCIEYLKWSTEVFICVYPKNVCLIIFQGKLMIGSQETISSSQWLRFTYSLDNAAFGHGPLQPRPPSASAVPPLALLWSLGQLKYCILDILPRWMSLVLGLLFFYDGFDQWLWPKASACCFGLRKLSRTSVN